MTNHVLLLSQNPWARNLVAKARLPIPLPEQLERQEGANVERPLEDKSVLVAGQGALSGVLARTLTRAGANPWLTSADLRSSFADPGEAYGRHARLVSEADAEEHHVHAIVLDATRIDTPAALKRLWQVYRPWLGALDHHGRSIVLARPPEQARTVNEAAAQQALDGWNRSLAKEIGGRAATANLIYVEAGAEERVPAALRFFLSKASAFVTGQSLRIRAQARFDGEDPITQPLAGKVALVTGAARGIGEAIARVLAVEGAHVVCLDRPEDDAALSLVARDVGGSLLLCDIASEDAPRRIATHFQTRHGGVDIVVHNAGITRDRTLARMSEQQWDELLAVNLQAVLRLNAALLERGLRDNARVVSLASIAGIAGNTGQTNYAASKAGIIGVTRFLANEVAARGITVNAVAPGFIETRMTAAVPAVTREVGRRLAALGQGGQPEDVARAIAFLVTPGAAGVSGEVLRVCGGALLGA